MNLFNCW